MNILYHCTFSDHEQWFQSLKKKFKGHKFYKVKDSFNFNNIDVAIVWNLPNQILAKIKNVKLIFSLGAGVDHIIQLPSYNHRTPIIRIKDHNMRKRMFNHVLSQILNFQLKLNIYQRAQQKKLWVEEREIPLNNELTIGVLGLGFIGSYVARELQKLNYQVVGYRNSIIRNKSQFRIFNGKKIDDFIACSDIIVSILPSTKKTKDFINKNFLKKMKKKSLLINIGRGASLNEKDILHHLNTNNNFNTSLDVFKKEPLSKNNKFWNHPNVTITPHIAAISDINSSVEYMYSRFSIFEKNGKISSDVDLKKGY